ncbi:hypothetical protein GS429_08510 [Natronorubrum sp. JWXQ-INN-674]|uniref:Uncharacterized protein n=1 Tax=Natronorubrum halalkaliphilum TaxID=2691917 RepID=A0A6B0VMW0_9EURY|nr:hypothetical protein [Natronorubrum halalkaliphilum]MXV62102.1 hypothetical protein [Natronorubrum halalkaliphilum]
MYTDDNHTEDGNGTNSTNLAETDDVVHSALETIEDETNADCQASVDETGYYILENPSNGDAWIRTQDIAEVRP